MNSMKYPAAFHSRELWFKNQEMPIYGMLYLPLEEKERYPTIICSHGFGDTSDQMGAMCRCYASNGFAAYAFDFCGGSPFSRSGAANGDMTHMSVLTEASDLFSVIDQIRELSMVDTDHLFLVGQSQGGYVSSYVAAKRPQDICALVLEFPAFALQDDCWRRFPHGVGDLQIENYMGFCLGAIYARDAMSMDIYREISAYHKDVLLLHGDKDDLVNLSYSERAARVYDHAKLVVYKGGEHGFAGPFGYRAAMESLEFMKEHLS